MAAFDYEDLQGLLDEASFYSRFDAADLGITPLPAAPTISLTTPAAETTINSASVVALSVTAPVNPKDGSAGLLSVRVRAVFGDGTQEVVYDGAAFNPSYSAASTRTVITNGFNFSITRSSGWPFAVAIVIDAFDTSGQLTTASRHFNSAGGGPVVLNLAPSLAIPILATDAIGFDLTYSAALRDLIVSVEYLKGSSEVVYRDGTARGLFTVNVTTITGGLRFLITRRGGWPASPSLVIKAIDVLGRENP